MAAQADVAIARQKRDKALYDVKRHRAHHRRRCRCARRSPDRFRCCRISAPADPGRAAPEFRRGDRAWFGAPIAELPDLTAVQMTARVDEADRGRVQTGSGVRVRVDAVPDSELTGTLKDISVVAKPDFTTWPPVRNFDLVVSLSDSDPRLRSGMSASARVELDRLPNVLVVPTGAVFQRGAATVVYVVNRGALESRARHRAAARPRSDRHRIGRRRRRARLAEGAGTGGRREVIKKAAIAIVVLLAAGAVVLRSVSRGGAEDDSDRARAARARAGDRLHDRRSPRLARDAAHRRRRWAVSCRLCSSPRPATGAQSRRRRRRIRRGRAGVQPRAGAIRSPARGAGDRQGRRAGGGAGGRRRGGAAARALRRPARASSICRATSW